MWVDQCSIVTCLKTWCSTSKASNLDIYDFINKWGKTDALLCANKDFLDMQLQNFRICCKFFLYICIWCLLKWCCMCNYASKVVQIAVHILGFLICELKINLYRRVWFLSASKFFFNLELGLFPLSVFVVSGSFPFCLLHGWFSFSCHAFSFSQPASLV